MVAHDRVEENREASQQRANFVLVVVGLLLLFVHSPLGDFDPQPYGTAAIDGSEVELFAPAGGSPVLVFFVAALLLVGRRRALASAVGRQPLWMAGAALLGLGVGFQRWADYVGATELLIPSLILLLLGSASLVAGRAGLRAIAVPALFLIFAFPLPAVLVNVLIWPLQLHTATSAHGFLRLIGYAPEKLADVIVLGGHSFQVIETCSGMRTIETLVMAACLYSILFFRCRSQAVFLILAAPIIGYFVNFVRVLSIIFNPYAQWSTVHTMQGIVMLVVGVLMIAGLDSLIQRWQAGTSVGSRSTTAQNTSSAPHHWSGSGTVVGVLVVLAVSNLVVPHWVPDETPPPRAFRLPGVLAGHNPTPLKLDRQFLGSVFVSNWLNREYEFGDARVRVQILADDRLNRRGSLVSTKTHVPGRGYVEISASEAVLFPGVFVDRYLYESPNQQTLVYHWTEGISSVLSEIARNALALDRGPTRRDSWALSVRLSTQVKSEAAGLENADARLREFASVMRDALE